MKTYYWIWILVAMLHAKHTQAVVPPTKKTPCPTGTLHVDASVIASGAGTTWANALKTLPEALNIMWACSSIDTIKVATGTYKPNRKPYSGGAPITTADSRDVTFHLPNGLFLLGGYPSGGGVRNATANPTILSGDIDIAGNNDAYHVILSTVPDSLTMGVWMDGFIVTGGRADYPSLIVVDGENIHQGTGGGMYLRRGINVFNNIIFRNNLSEYQGGGVYAEIGHYTFNDVIQYNNSAVYGGAFAIFYSTAILTRTIMHTNAALYHGGAYYGQYNKTLWHNNLMYGNTCNYYGGAIWEFESTNTFTNNTLYGNACGNYDGGALYTYNSTNTITNCLFWSNTKNGNSSVAGADIANNGATNNITYSLTQPNSLYTSGTGIVNALQPLFVNPTDPDGFDDTYRTADDGFCLQFCSPVVNAGTNIGISATDITGAARPQQSITDIGAYENNGYNRVYTLTSNFLPADAECTTEDGWTHYLNTSNEALILSIKKNGNNIGSIGDGILTISAGGYGITNLGTASTTPAPYSKTPNWYALNRYWNVVPNGQPTSDVNIRAYYTSVDFGNLQTSSGIAAPTDMVFYKINGSGNPDPATAHAGTPSTPAATYDDTGYWEYFNSITPTTSTWAGGTFHGNAYAEMVVRYFSGGGSGAGAGGGGALPIELLSFTAKSNGYQHLLTWVTASETNNKGFVVQHSSDARNFTNLYFVPGKGTTTAHSTYHYTNTKPLGGTNYYRLQQVDTDGKITYSNTITLEYRAAAASVQVSPNPSNGIFQLSGLPQGVSEVTLSNVLGITTTVPIVQNAIHIAHLPKGIYFMQVDDNHQVIRIVLQ
jgi:hypothetical protein